MKSLAWRLLLGRWPGVRVGCKKFLDDVADTGETLKLVKDFLEGYVAEVRFAVLYEKPTTVITPDYTWRHTDKWIEFPWSVQGKVTTL